MFDYEIFGVKYVFVFVYDGVYDVIGNFVEDDGVYVYRRRRFFVW